MTISANKLKAKVLGYVSNAAWATVKFLKAHAWASLPIGGENKKPVDSGPGLCKPSGDTPWIGDILRPRKPSSGGGPTIEKATDFGV